MKPDTTAIGAHRPPEPARYPVRQKPAATADVLPAVPPLEKQETALTPAVRGLANRLGVQQQLPPNTRLRVDEETKQIVAQILDENNEVIRQIPPEALLELSTRFNRLEGLLFNRES